jgi:hypothetical protein
MSDWITKKEKPKAWITKKPEKGKQWITKKEGKPKAWITKKKKELSSGLRQIPEKELPKRPKAWITKKQRSEPRDEQTQSAGRTGYRGGGRTNLLEELGRVEAEPSNRNRRAEVSRIHGELNKGYKKGGRIRKGNGGSAAQQHYLQHGYGPTKAKLRSGKPKIAKKGWA